MLLPDLPPPPPDLLLVFISRIEALLRGAAQDGAGMAGAGEEVGGRLRGR